MPNSYTIAAIKQCKNDEHLQVVPNILPGIFEDLLPVRVCDKWETFGKCFGVKDAELSKIKSQEKKAYSYGTLQEKNLFEVVLMLVSDQNRFTFSKKKIYEALGTCDPEHPEYASKFREDYYKRGSLYVSD